MAVVRRATDKDATWARAWTADAAADLASIADPRHGDVAFVSDEGLWYSWRDDGTWEPSLTAFEEGDWTPELAGQTTPGTFSYTTQVGKYSRIGRLVFLNFNLFATISVAPTGNLRIEGIPYNGGSTMRAGSMVSVYSGFTLSAGYDVFSANVNGPRLELVKSGTGVAATNVGSSELTGTFILRGSIFYPI